MHQAQQLFKPTFYEITYLYSSASNRGFAASAFDNRRLHSDVSPRSDYVILLSDLGPE